MMSRREAEAIRVLIVDDHRLFADAIMTTLQDHGIEVLDIASSGAEAVTLTRRHLPEVVLLDIGLPDRSGLSVGQELLEECPDARIIALTGIEDPQLVREAARVGFRGYLRKDANVQEFVDAVRRTVSGETVFPNGYRRFIRPKPAYEEMTDSLSNRELQVLALLAEGASSRRIAEALDISPNTVRTHVQSVLTKLQVHSRLQAVAFAIRHDLLADQGGLGA
jgi:DNA-binding NarL/FixJ family response regulator